MDQSNYFAVNRQRILDKWSPVLKNAFKFINNKEILDIMSLYSEWIHLKLDNDPTLKFDEKYTKLKKESQNLENQLAAMLKTAVNKFVELSPRKKVITNWFNPILNQLEYELEDGSIINFSEPIFDKDIYVKIFPIDFLSNIYPDIVRDSNINSILEEPNGSKTN